MLWLGLIIWNSKSLHIALWHETMECFCAIGSKRMFGKSRVLGCHPHLWNIKSWPLVNSVLIAVRADVSSSLQSTSHVCSGHLMTYDNNTLLFDVRFFVLSTCLLNSWLIPEGEIEFWPLLGIRESVWIYSIFDNGFPWLELVPLSVASSFKCYIIDERAIKIRKVKLNNFI